MFEVDVNGLTQQYRTKPTMNINITGSSGGGGGGGGVQPNWNQNDETAADYIKNRPFYTSDPSETVLVEESTVSFTSPSSGIYYATIQSAFKPTAGETYKVSWDGAAYECVGETISGYPVIGNPSVIGVGADTGEPFVISPLVDNSGIEIYTKDASASHTFSISGFVTEVVKIDENFLPKYVSYEVQDLTDEEKTIARNNVNALSKDVLVEIPTNIVLASDFERYYEKHKETGLPIKWNGKNIIYIEYLGSDNGIKDYVLSIGRLLFRIEEYIYNGEKHLALSNTENFYNDICADQIIFRPDLGESQKIISLDSLGNLITNDGGTVMIWNDGVVVESCTQNSTKKFKITVDDSGTISATEVT